MSAWGRYLPQSTPTALYCTGAACGLFLCPFAGVRKTHSRLAARSLHGWQGALLLIQWSKPWFVQLELDNLNRTKILIPLVEVSGRTYSLRMVGVSPGLHTADSPESGSIGAYPSRCLQGVNVPALTKNNWKPSIFVGNVKYFLIVTWTPFEGSPEC